MLLRYQALKPPNGSWFRGVLVSGILAPLLAYELRGVGLLGCASTKKSRGSHSSWMGMSLFQNVLSEKHVTLLKPVSGSRFVCVGTGQKGGRSHTHNNNNNNRHSSTWAETQLDDSSTRFKIPDEHLSKMSKVSIMAALRFKMAAWVWWFGTSLHGSWIQQLNGDWRLPQRRSTTSTAGREVHTHTTLAHACTRLLVNIHSHPTCMHRGLWKRPMEVAVSAPLESAICKQRWVFGKARFIGKGIVGKHRVLSWRAGWTAGVRKAGRILVQWHGEVQVFLERIKTSYNKHVKSISTKGETWESPPEIYSVPGPWAVEYRVSPSSIKRNLKRSCLIQDGGEVSEKSFLFF